MQAVASGLASELQRRGYGIQVITARLPRTLPAQERIDGVAVRRWTFLAPRPGYLRRGRADLWLAGLAALPVTLARLLRHIARERPDVVNLQFAGSPALFVLLADRLRRFRLVVSLHGDDVEGLPYRSALDRATYRALVNRADLVTACSRYLAQQSDRLAGSARVVYNGIRPYSCPPAAPRGEGLFAAGRLVPKKGFDVLLRALAECGDRTLRLTISGDGPERDSLRALAHELRLDERVVFAGARPHHEVMSGMFHSSLVVVPSRQEPFGLVALEAMQAGRPVVASAAGGLPELLADADALLVPPGDAAALAGAIDRVLSRLASQPEYGARNRQLAQRFSLDRMVDGYAQAYAEVMRA